MKEYTYTTGRCCLIRINFSSKRRNVTIIVT